MASITIRNLDDDVKRRLRVRAVENGRSTEEEAQDILRQVVGQPGTPSNLGQSIHARLAALGGVDLPPAKRTPTRPVPDLE
jgi:antitoxin FitA